MPITNAAVKAIAVITGVKTSLANGRKMHDYFYLTACIRACCL